MIKNLSLLALRVGIGWLMLYAGLTKIFNPSWTAGGYLANAKTFGAFYNLFLAPGVLPLTNFINEWGLTLLGLSLIFGFWVRLSAALGALLMLLYYFPVLEFPYIGEHSFIVDEHIIYALVLLYFSVIRAGRIFGLDSKFPSRFG